mgnify:CR=1 FL=1
MLQVDLLIRYDGLTIDSRFSVPEGSGAALMGPSGAGKSSILSVIAGFEKAARSEIYFRGQRLDGLKPAKRPLTILFQEHNLFPHMSVWKNIAIGLSPRLKLTRQQRERLEHSLEWMGLSGMQDRLPATLSGGQQQRVALARCLVREHPLLLLDEPFSGLYVRRQQDLRELIQRLMREKNLTLLMSTHQAEDAEALCQQIIQVEARDAD